MANMGQGPDLTLTDEEKGALGDMAWRDGVMLSRWGVKIATIRSLEAKGLVELDHLTGRKWVAVLTEAGKSVAQEFIRFNYVPPVAVSKASTRRVARELFKDHPLYRLTVVYEQMDYSSLEAFERSVRAWMGDRSELRTRVLDGADYRELYIDFSEYMEKVPVLPGSGHRVSVPLGDGRTVAVSEDEFGKPVRHVKTGELVGFLDQGGAGFRSVAVVREIIKGRKSK